MLYLYVGMHSICGLRLDYCHKCSSATSILRALQELLLSVLGF